MGNITVPLEKEFKERMDSFSWVNWSAVGRNEMLKRDIFDKYIKTGKISKEDAKFCERIDWHPVDELPLRAEYIKKLKRIEKERHSRMSLKEVDRLMGLE